MADGGMSEWFRAPARSLVDLPEGLARDRRLPGGAHRGGLALLPPRRRRPRPAGVRGRRGRHRADGGGRGPGDGCRRGVPGGPLPAPGRAGRAARRHAARRGCTTSSSRPPAPRARCTAAPSWPRPSGSMGVLGVFGPETTWPQMQCFMKELRTVPTLGYCRHCARSRLRRRRQPPGVDAAASSTR